MDIEEILNICFYHLSNDLKSNKSLLKIKDTCISLLKTFNQNFYVEINERIYNNVNRFHNQSGIIPLPSCEDEIFSVSSHSDNDLIFSLSKREDYHYITFNTSTKVEENLHESVDINIVISSSTTTWSITKIIVDENDYYEAYDFEMHSYNINNEELKIDNIEEEKDKNFSEFFGVPLDDSRKYRLNFNEYKDVINESKIKKEMKKIDSYYSDENKLFTPPFLMTEMASYLLDALPTKDDLEDDEDYYDEFEERELIDENLIKEKASYIENEMLKRTGTLGIFTMSYNLYLNLTAYLSNPNIPLTTSGLIIRKIKNKYTSFYTSFENNRIIIIEKELSIEEAKKLYESNSNNKQIYGVEDFFTETFNYGLK